MTDEEKISLFEETIGLDKGTATLGTELKTLEMWDSVGKLFFLSMIKKEFGRDLAPSLIRGFETVSDIVREMRD
jgi:acyl carrier protein